MGLEQILLIPGIDAPLFGTPALVFWETDQLVWETADVYWTLNSLLP